MQLTEHTYFGEGNRYYLEKLLGRGGFSEVWLVKDTLTDTEEALKVYAPGTGMDNDGLHFFTKELNIVHNIHHPNLLTSSYVGVWQNMPYLIMPYCPQGSLVKKIGQITENEAWAILKDVATGLEYLHSQPSPIIHQDIKPDNILVDTLGHYVITDFGISARAQSTLRKSVRNAATGTGAYMGPERFGTDPLPIKASDIWALGATLFELIEGYVPFGDLGGLSQKSGADIPHMKANVSDKLKQTIYSMLAKEPWDRPTAAQLAKGESADKSSSNVENTLLDETIREEFKRQTNTFKNMVWICFLCVIIVAFGVWRSIRNYQLDEEDKLSNNDTVQVVETIEVVEVKKADRDGEVKRLQAENIRLQEENKRLQANELKEKKMPESVKVIKQNPQSQSSPASVNSRNDRITFTVNGVSFTMIKVEGGTFTMGATSEQGSHVYDDEMPTHNVTLSTYYMGETEVTQALWQAIMGNNPSHFMGKDSPVETVSWDDCLTFIDKLNSLLSSQLGGKRFALPTEAQWEYAARGGQKNHKCKFSGSNSLSEVAWYFYNSRGATHPVMKKQANELGLYDMSGNVGEWCQDWYGVYSETSQTNPTGPRKGSKRVFRGNSCDSSGGTCRVSCRCCFSPSLRSEYIGLRLVCIPNEMDSKQIEIKKAIEEYEEMLEVIEKLSDEDVKKSAPTFGLG